MYVKIMPPTSIFTDKSRRTFAFRVPNGTIFHVAIA